MRREPYDQSDLDDVTTEFWGDTSGWSRKRRRRHPETRPAADRNDRTDRNDNAVTGAIRAIKDGFNAFRPRTVGDTSSFERTRSHGIVRPDSDHIPDDGGVFDAEAPRKPVASNDLSISELGAGQTTSHPLDAWSALDDWSELDELTSRHRAIDASAEHRRMVSAEHLVRSGESAGADNARYYSEHRYYADVVPTADHERGFRDPRIMKIGGAILVTLAIVPFAFRGSDGEAIQQGEPIAAVATESTSPLAAAPAADDADVAADEPAEDADRDLADVVADTPTDDETAEAGDPDAETTAEFDGESEAAPSESLTEGMTVEARTGSTTESSEGSDEVAVTEEAAERVVPDCSNSFEAVAGDSWYAIADRADISPDELMQQNNATLDSVILPGDEICLPAGVTVDEREEPTTTTQAPEQTDAPDTTEAPETTTTTEAPETTTTTDAPETTTTEAPESTTPTGSPGQDATPDEVKALIRDVFPDDAEDKAIEIAYLESNYLPTAYNGHCCYGLFQIYWTVHDSWLGDLGIHSKEDLYDPLLNTQAALELYHRSGNSFSAWTTA